MTQIGGMGWAVEGRCQEGGDICRPMADRGLWWLGGEESACSAGDRGLIPGLGKSPGNRNGYPL